MGRAYVVYAGVVQLLEVKGGRMYFILGAKVIAYLEQVFGDPLLVVLQGKLEF